MESLDTVIIDIGAGTTKIGRLDMEKPIGEFPTVIGMPPFDYGHGAEAARRQKRLERPINQGTIQKWDHMEYLLQKIFTHELQAAPEESALILVDHDLNSNSDRDRMIKLLFEKVGVSSLFLISQAVAGAAAVRPDLDDALVVYSGFDSSYVIPIINNRPLYDKLTRFNQSGEHTTRKLAQLMQQHRGYSFTAPYELEYVDKVKQSYGFVAQDRLPVSLTERAFELPDGQVLSVRDERYLCTESMFDSSKGDSVQNAVIETLNKLSDAEKTSLASRVVLVGGNTRFSGFSQRLSYELKLLDQNLDFQVFDQREVEHVPYRGAIACARSNKFQSQWVVNKDHQI